MSLAPYEALVALADREAGLIEAGDWDGLAAVAEERAALVATLPAVAPEAALPILKRLASSQAIASAALAAAMVRIRAERGTMGTRRTAVRGYAAAAAQR